MPMSDADARQYAVFVHLSSLATLIIPLGNLLGPLILWLAKKEESAFVDRHGVAAVNFNISLLVYVAGTMVLFVLVTILTLGIGALLMLPLLLVAAVVMLVLEIVFMVQAIQAASRGQDYRYPMSIPFVQPSARWSQPLQGFTPV